MSRDFHVCDVLSVTSGVLLSPDSITGVYEILGHLVGFPLFTHMLPSAADAVRPAVVSIYPWLTDVQLPDFDRVADRERLADTFAEYMDAQYGRLSLPVMPDAYRPNGPLGIGDIAEMRRKAEEDR